MRKTLCILLTLLLSLSSVGALAAFNAPGTFPISDEKITLTIAVPDNPSIEDYETNNMTLLLEEQTGFDLQFEVYPSTDYATKLNIMVMGGDTLPDILIRSGDINDSMVFSWAQEGAIVPLTSYYEDPDISYWLHDAVERCGTDFFSQIISPDGEIYYIPQFNQSYGNEHPAKMFLYQPWLDALGMEAPTTTDEFYEVLKAVASTDLNGNGKADEIGLTGAGFTNANWFSLLMGSFVYTTPGGGNYLTVEDGTVGFAYQTDAWKEGLRYIRKLFEEGLMPMETLTQDLDQWRTMLSVEDDTVFAQAYTSASQVNATYTDRRNNFIAYLPLTGPDGVRTATYTPSVAQPHFMITADCENPEAAFRLGDLMCNEYYGITTRFGQEGVDWDYFDVVENKEDYVPYVAGWDIMIIVYDDATFWGTGVQQNRCWMQVGPYIRQYGIANGRAADPATVSKFDDNTSNANNLYQMTEGLSPAEVIPKLIYTVEENETASPILATLRSYVEETTASFLAGKLDIDADWDTFQNELSVIGIEQAQEIIQGVYDRMYK